MNKYMSKPKASSVTPVFSKLKKTLLSLSVCMVLVVPSLSQAGRIDEPPTPLAMIGDIMVRPIMAGATVIGAGLFIGTLPFSLPGGNAGQAGDVLVVKPFQATFMRCLGCTNANSGAFGGTQPVDR